MKCKVADATNFLNDIRLTKKPEFQILRRTEAPNGFPVTPFYEVVKAGETVFRAKTAIEAEKWIQGALS